MAKKMAFSVLVTCIFILFMEVILRLLGILPLHHFEYGIIDCYNQFTDFNTKIGYRNESGQYECLLVNTNDPTETKSYFITHDNYGSRIVQNQYLLEDSISNNIHFYGCSTTWGHGVNDTSTFPYLVSKQLAHDKVYNFGVGGFSMVQGMLLLQDNLSKGLVPEIAVFNYGSFHDSRTMLSWGWRKIWQQMIYNIDKNDFNRAYPNFRLPYADLRKGELVIDYMTADEIRAGIPFHDKSSIMWLVNNAYEIRKERNLKDSDIAISVFDSIKNICEENDIVFILCGIYDTDETDVVLNHFKQSSNLVVDCAVDTKDSRYNLMPYDGHHNHIGYQMMADKFVTFYNSIEPIGHDE